MNNLGKSQKNILSREKAWEVLESYEPDVVSAIRIGLDRFARLPPEIRSRLRNRVLANLLNDLVVDDAKARFHDDTTIAIDEACDGTFFIARGKIALRFKKIDRNLTPRNAPTHRQSQIWDQQYEFDGIKRLTVVNVGYQLNQLWTEIVGVSLICRRGADLLWKIPIADKIESHMFMPSGNVNERVIRPPKVRSTRPRGGKDHA